MESSLQLLGQWSQRDSKNNVSYFHCPLCLPELEGKTLLLTPHTSDTGCGGMELEMIREPLSFGLDLIVSESNLQATKGERKPVELLHCKVQEPQALDWQNNPY